MNKSNIKICGVKNIDTIICCIKNKIKFFGLIFYTKSPRNIEIAEALELINFSTNKNIYSVGVFVNEKLNVLLNTLKKLPLNFIQLHGSETNAYIKAVKKNNKIKVIKVIMVKTLKDFKKIDNYPDTDMFLFDYKPSKNELPGGNAKSFNWELLKNVKIQKQWFLSGGINIRNIKDIENFTIPYGIDISSGVEDKLGIKNNAKISSLIKHYGTNKKFL